MKTSWAEPRQPVSMPLGATAYVVASDAPIAARKAATLLKGEMGNRVQLCDGTADDVEIQAAITALPSGGGLVSLSSGTFNTTAQISCVSGLHLKGEGPSTVIFKSSDFANYMLRINADSNVIISDLQLDGNKTTNTQALDNILIDGASLHVVIRKIISAESERYGLHLSGSTLRRVLVDGCLFSGNLVVGVGFESGAGYTRIKGCAFYQNGTGANSAAIRTGAASASPHVVVEGCEIEGQGRSSGLTDYAILLNRALHWTILGNNIHDLTKGILILDASHDVTLTGNVIRNIGPTGSVSGDAIYAGSADSSKLSVTNNTITDCSDTGIASLSPGTVIEGNSISGAGAQGIALTAAHILCVGNDCKNNGINTGVAAANRAGIRLFDTNADNCVVVGNQCYDDQGSPTQQYGISVAAGATDSIILGNNVVGNVLAGILDGGTTTWKRNNVGYVTENSGASTGTGAQQTIAHGLGFTPTRQQIALTPGSATALPFHSAAPDATNIYVTAVNLQAWYWATVG